MQELNLFKDFFSSSSSAVLKIGRYSKRGSQTISTGFSYRVGTSNDHSVLDGSSHRHLPERLQIICYAPRPQLLVAVVIVDSNLERCLLLGVKEQVPLEP